MSEDRIERRAFEERPDGDDGSFAGADRTFDGRTVGEDRAFAGRAAGEESAFVGRAVAADRTFDGRTPGEDRALTGRAAGEDRVGRRAADLLPEERAAGSADPRAQAEAILADSDDREADRVEVREARRSNETFIPEDSTR